MKAAIERTESNARIGYPERKQARRAASKNEKMEEKLKKIFKDNDMSYDYECEGNIVYVIVDWGDWKHDHGFLNYVMRNNGFELVAEKVTEEDGSDYYSSIHGFRYNK